jgi:hypothetical protein
MLSKKLMLQLSAAALVFVALVYGGCSLTTDIPHGEGEYSGVITRFSHDGNFVMLWEGDLATTGATQKASSSWTFTVTDPEVIKKVQAAQRSGGVTTLHYKRTLNPSSWKSTTGFYVVDVVPHAK